MTVRCDHGKAMLERLLAQETPGSPTREDMNHAQGCEECKKAISRLGHIDRPFNDYFSLIRRAAPSVRWRERSLPASENHSPVSMPAWGGFWTAAIGVAVLVVAIGLGVAFRASHVSPPAQTRSEEFQASWSPEGWSRLDLGQDSKTMGQWIECPAARSFRNESGVRVGVESGRIRLASKAVEVGEGRLGVEVPPGKGIAFHVTTPVAVLRVHGTRFEVVVKTDGSTRVRVSEGSVEVASTSGEKGFLEGGQAVLIDKEGRLAPEESHTEPTNPAGPGAGEPGKPVGPDAAFH